MDAIQINSHKNKLIEGPLLLKPNIFNDDRGYFYESWNKKSLEKLVFENLNFVQDNHSKSKLGVLRGMHFQIPPKAQAKLVRCTHGEIFDVIVDLRMNSKTFGEWYGVYLNENNKFQLWIPKGFAHGYLCLDKINTILYLLNKKYSGKKNSGFRWNDKTFNIKWNITKPILSRKDSNLEGYKKN